MDKYTYSLKVEKIGKLVRQGDYVQAAKIADTMEWGQERNVRLLTSVGEAYEKTGQYTKAIDVLLTAYERSAIGKRLMYKLTELAIAAGDLEDAETFYKKYLQEAPDENNRFILRYKIAEAKGEDLEKRIAILEIYKKHEFDEEWACRLAELYQEAGRAEECVALCDEIILWFGVGPYVDRAMELKESFRPLTDAQREHRENREYYEARVKAVANEMAQAVEEKTATLGISEDEALPEKKNAVPEEAEEEELPVIAISDESGMAKLADAAGSMLAPEPDLPVIPDEEDFELPEDDLSDTQVFGRREKKDSGPQAQEEPAVPKEKKDSGKMNSEKVETEAPESLPEDFPAAAEPEAETAAAEMAGAEEEETAEKEAAEMAEAEEEETAEKEATEKEAAAAESAEEEFPDDVFMEDELSDDGLLSADMVETVFAVPEEGMEEEPAVKEPAQPAGAEEPASAKSEKPRRKLPQLTMPEIPEGDLEEDKPEEPPKKTQKEPAKGSKPAFQMPKMPDLRKIGKGRQTGGALPEPAIPPKEADPMELEEAINAALEAESMKEDGEYPEEKQPRTREEMAITRNLKNLLRRTLGNATVPPPESMGETQEFTLPRRRRREKDASAEESRRARTQAEKPVKPERRKPAGQLPEEAERSGAPIAPDSLDEILGEEKSRTPKTRRPAAQQPIPLAEDPGVLPVISYDETARAAWEQNAGQRTETRNPLESKEMERCLFVEATGEEGVNRAVDALEAYYQARKRELGPIAKITGEKLNRRGLIKSLSQLGGKDLIIDKAGTLSNELLQEILRVIERLDTNKVFVLMEEAEGMADLKERLTTQLLSTTSLVEEAMQVGRRPKAPAAGTEPASSERQRSAKKVKPLNFDRIDPRQELSRADFLRYADYFARTLQCVIDDSGFDALEDEIDLIRQEGGKLLAGEVEDVIEDAAENASRPSIRRMFGAKYDKDGFLILRDRNFT